MIRIRQIKVLVTNNQDKALKKEIIKKLHLKENTNFDYQIKRKSIDARDKNNIYYVYTVDINILNEEEILNKLHNKDIFKTPNEEYILPSIGTTKLNDRIIIVGSGPAGLFCAFFLSLMGYKPLIIERGKCLEERVSDVENFWQNGSLNLNSNVQFGEGGAGTFSDGKLNTLVKDKRNIGKKVLEIFTLCGAPSEILYESHPHIGTDKLRNVIINMRNKIIDMGGKFRYNTKLTDLIIENNELKGIIVNDSKIINCSNLILAIGHSARDTFRMLLNNGLNMEAKPFAVGLRIMHDQEIVNKSMYGAYARILPPANYKLTYKAQDKRGVYTFCMCPGGYVVNASSENGRLAINGMSNYKRESGTANSAVIVTVSPKDFGTNPLDGIKFQEKLEQNAFNLGNGAIIVQKYLDFKQKRISNNIDSSLKIKGKIVLEDLNKILPVFINKDIIEAIEDFGKKIACFNNDNAFLAGVESRTSSPVRIIRNEFMEANIKGIYPIGEGAGYAGGITTSAIDGIKMAEVIIKKYSNK